MHTRGRLDLATRFWGRIEGLAFDYLPVRTVVWLTRRRCAHRKARDRRRA